MYCPFCGCELSEQVKFCHNCGEKIPESDKNDTAKLPTSHAGKPEVAQHAVSKSPTPKKKKKKNKALKIAGIICCIPIVLFICLFAAVCGIAIFLDSYDAEHALSYSQAIESTDPLVQSYALKAIPTYHRGEYSVEQICDVYDKLYKDWTYVSDPYINSNDFRGEYVAPASESVVLLHGDCDDHAILMASLIESIGGKARVIIARNEEGVGHAYAEVYLGDFKEGKSKVINTIKRRYGVKTVYYHIDENGDYWLNLDYQSNYPGSRFYYSVGEELVIWSDGTYIREDLVSGVTDYTDTDETRNLYASSITKSIESENSLVHAYALSAISPSHAGEYNIHQLRDIYNKLNKDWVYVNTPVEYADIAPASESVTVLKGNSADYAVLMASLIESMGETARVIVAYNSNGERYIYPEVNIADSEIEFRDLADILSLHYGYIYCRIDDSGSYWINLDRTEKQPGGKFFESFGNELVVWSDGSYNTLH
ncbi:MAG: hypothetical protein E7Z72_05035 [Methanocorpusculum parvum]|nr:hypothetical protein [Methanocorpusculum parvum]